MGLSPEYFWGLTWYEWGFEVLKLYEEGKRKADEWESYLSIKRMEIADFRNAHFRTEAGTPLNLTPQDIVRLSFDKNIVEERPMTFKEVKASLGSKFRKDVNTK